MNSISQDLFYKIRSRFTGLKLGKETGEITIDPMEAAFFDFDYMDGENPIGHVSVSLAEPTSMKVYYSTGITEGMNITQKEGWYNFLKELRSFAKRRLMSFDTRDIAKDNLDKRDYQFLVQNAQSKKNPVGESIMSESSMYGSKTVSYQKLMDTRLIIKHSHALADDQVPGARSRNISALFVENQAGERFKYPFIHLAGARAMQRHVANGGVPYDDIGKSIVGMSEEIAQLKSFGNYVVRNDLMNSSNNNIVERSSTYLNNLREQLAKLSKQGYYEQYKENFSAGEQLEVPQDVVETFTDQFTVKNFKEDIKSVFPILYRLMSEEQKSTEIGYDDIVEMTGVQDDDMDEEFEAVASDPFTKFEQWAMSLGETSSIQSHDEDEKAQAVKELQALITNPFPAGVDGTNAIESLKGIIDDPKLAAGIKAVAKTDPEKDVREMVKGWLDQNAPDVVQSLDFGDVAAPEQNIEDPQQYANDAADADAVAYGQQESIEEAGEEDPKKKRKWGSYWKDYDKKPEDFGVKPNANAGKPYPKYKRVPRPGATKDWDVDYVYDNPDEKAAYDQGDKDYYAQPEYKAYSDARSVHHKEMEKVKKSHYAQKGRFDSTITIMNPFFDPKSTDPEDEDTPEEIDVGVDYDVEYHGEDRPGTWEEPPEYAERDVYITRVVDLDTGEDITDEVDHDKIAQALDDQGDIMSASDYAQDQKDQAAIDRYEANRESIEPEGDAKQGSMNVQEVAQFINSFYDKHTKSFPKGPEGVAVMVGKKFGEQAEHIARKFVERMAPHQSTEQNPELAELARVKELSGVSTQRQEAVTQESSGGYVWQEVGDDDDKRQLTSMAKRIASYYSKVGEKQVSPEEVFSVLDSVVREFVPQVGKMTNVAPVSRAFFAQLPVRQNEPEYDDDGEEISDEYSPEDELHNQIWSMVKITADAGKGNTSSYGYKVHPNLNKDESIERIKKLSGM